MQLKFYGLRCDTDHTECGCRDSTERLDWFSVVVLPVKESLRLETCRCLIGLARFLVGPSVSQSARPCVMRRLEIEKQLHEGRIWLLNEYASLSEEQLHTGLTPSEHDPSNLWSPLDHLAHLSLIEHNFAAMIRRHVAGHENPVGLRTDAEGNPRSMAEIMAGVHAMTDEWQVQHAGKSFDEVVALGQVSRAVTLTLLAELTDEQLAETLPGAPWADGTVGGVLGANAGHGRMHWKWVTDAFHPEDVVPA
jgi:DinB superfamily